MVYMNSKREAEAKVIALDEAEDLSESMEQHFDILCTTFAWVVLILAGLWFLHTLAQAAVNYPEWKGLVQ